VDRHHTGIGDLQAIAKERLPPGAYVYVAGGAGDERTMRDNIEAFGRWRFVPRVLVDTSARTLSTTVLGRPIALPIGIAPFALQRLLDPEAERATTRAAAAAGTLATVPTLTSYRHAELQAAADGPRWLQLYVQLDRAWPFAARPADRAVPPCDHPGTLANHLHESFPPD